VIVSLRQWGEDHCFDKSERHSVLVGKANGQRVPKLMLRGGARRDGALLARDPTESISRDDKTQGFDWKTFAGPGRKSYGNQ
jgi:hypothetical protein